MFSAPGDRPGVLHCGYLEGATPAGEVHPFFAAVACLVILAGCGDVGRELAPPAPAFRDPAEPGLGPGGAESGGVAAEGGSGGTHGGAPVTECLTSSLCPACPVQSAVCDGSDECDVGWSCVPSGCTTEEGTGVRHCQPSAFGFCTDDIDCPSPSAPSEDYHCASVPGEGLRCVKQTPGCESDRDCILGFSCEDGACVDRRVPCARDADCPVSYACDMPAPNTRFCVRIYETCESELDCGILSPFCEDVDDDGRRECSGGLGLNEVACINASSCSADDPVCEASGVGSSARCGKHGLCKSDGECASGFVCQGVWSDGRKECVPPGGSCDATTDCPVNQVCASARTGGAPACQSGDVN